MNILSRILNAFKTTHVPVAMPPLPEGTLRIHFLSGNFGSQRAAQTYCFDAIGDEPEQITRDQPDAFIDTGFVEVVFQNAESRLAEFLPPSEAQRIVTKMQGTDTLVLITEDAFAGLPYALASNKQVAYLGAHVVDV